MNVTATSPSAAPSMSRRTLVLGAGAAAAGILALDIAPAVAQGSEAPQMTATGSFVGKKGNVDVRIVMEDDQLAGIIVSSHETPGLGTTALEQLRGLILSGQTLNVDSISGATLSSFALVNAVRAGLPKQHRRVRYAREKRTRRFGFGSRIAHGGGVLARSRGRPAWDGLWEFSSRRWERPYGGIL